MQLSGGQGRYSRTREREARFRQSRGAREQLRRQQSAACKRRARGFRLPERTQVFLSCFGLIRQHFALKRHLLRACLYRKQLVARFEAWRLLAGLTQKPSTAI
ncbi:hypothetical protein BGLA2_780047 [Burkholderia gladioli]|nr:hypothetical protein BGLA2_780047 [Burkholderia gladioli]